MQRRNFVLGMAGALAGASLISGCTTTGSAPKDAQARRAEIDAGVDGALTRLYGSVNGSRELASRSQGILVFPRVLGAGFIVGGETGDGALRTKAGTSGYYRTTAASVGLTAGGQSRAVIMMFMTPESYERFVNSRGWTVGADASVALARVGANGAVDTLSVQQPIIAFVQTNAGLMFDVSLNGARITRLDL